MGEVPKYSPINREMEKHSVVDLHSRYSERKRLQRHGEYVSLVLGRLRQDLHDTDASLGYPETLS